MRKRRAFALDCLGYFLSSWFLNKLPPNDDLNIKFYILDNLLSTAKSVLLDFFQRLYLPRCICDFLEKPMPVHKHATELFPFRGQDGTADPDTPGNQPPLTFNPSRAVFNFCLFPLHILEFHTVATFELGNGLFLGHLWLLITVCIINISKKEILGHFTVTASNFRDDPLRREQ